MPGHLLAWIHRGERFRNNTPRRRRRTRKLTAKNCQTETTKKTPSRLREGRRLASYCQGPRTGPEETRRDSSSGVVVDDDHGVRHPSERASGSAFARPSASLPGPASGPASELAESFEQEPEPPSESGPERPSAKAPGPASPSGRGPERPSELVPGLTLSSQSKAVQPQRLCTLSVAFSHTSRSKLSLNILSRIDALTSIFPAF